MPVVKKALLFFLVFVLLLISAELAFTYSSTAPPLGYTNAPLEGNCTTCHSSFPLTLSGSAWNNISLTSSVPLGQFLPNQLYPLSLSFSDSSSVKYGFEMVVLPSGATASSTHVGALTSTTPHTEVNFYDTREYISHSATGTGAASHTKTWTFNWQTPVGFTGNVDFYVVINSTNNDGTNSGDRIYAKVFSSTILPVKWLSYSVRSEHGKHYIQWATASEWNNFGFEVEKSTDAKTWNTIAMVKAKGGTNRITHYEYIDAATTPDVKNYYRIKQVDMNGSYEYTKVLFTETEGAPAAEHFSYDPLLQKIKISNSTLMSDAVLYTLSGVSVCSDSHGEMLDVAGLNKGIYILKLPSGHYHKVYLY